MEILYRAVRVYIWCTFASNPIVVLIGSMSTRRNATQRLEKEISNAGAPPRGDKVPHVEEDANIDKDPDKPPPLTDRYIRASLIHLAQTATVKPKL